MEDKVFHGLIETFTFFLGIVSPSVLSAEGRYLLPGLPAPVPWEPVTSLVIMRLVPQTHAELPNIFKSCLPREKRTPVVSTRPQ